MAKKKSNLLISEAFFDALADGDIKNAIKFVDRIPDDEMLACNKNNSTLLIAVIVTKGGSPERRIKLLNKLLKRKPELVNMPSKVKDCLKYPLMRAASLGLHQEFSYLIERKDVIVTEELVNYIKEILKKHKSKQTKKYLKGTDLISERLDKYIREKGYSNGVLPGFSSIKFSNSTAPVSDLIALHDKANTKQPVESAVTDSTTDHIAQKQIIEPDLGIETEEFRLLESFEDDMTDRHFLALFQAIYEQNSMLESLGSTVTENTSLIKKADPVYLTAFTSQKSLGTESVEVPETTADKSGRLDASL